MRVGDGTPGPGRPKGLQNKSTLALKSEAQKHAEKAIKLLARMIDEGESDNARITAAKELLDRGFGRAPVSVDVAADISGKLEVTWKGA